MDPPEVPEDEGVAALRLVGGAVGQPKVPVGVVIPGMRLEELVLVLGARLGLP